MDDEQLLGGESSGLLSLNLDEMRAIQQHYRDQGREPTDVELETWPRRGRSIVRTRHLRPRSTTANWMSKGTTY